MGLVYISPAFSGDPAFEGFGHALVLDPAADSVQVASRGIFRKRWDFLYFSYSLSPQLSPSGQQNFWTTSMDFNNLWPGPDFLLVKGAYDKDKKEVDWQVQHKVELSKYGAKINGIPHIDFDPSGEVGWAFIPSDIQGGLRNNLNPVFIQSTDGGQTWLEPEEINLSQFAGLQNRIAASKAGANSKISCMNLAALTVDVLGNPHYLFMVTVADSLPNGSFSYRDKDFLALYDLTKNPCDGNWELIYLDDIQVLEGVLGDPSAGTYFFYVNNYSQVSRNQAGDKIFFSWIDTDTTGMAIPANTSPDLKGRALDIYSNSLTPVMNWTQNDPTWQGKMLAPKTAAICLQEQDTFRVPTVFMRMDSNIAWKKVSLWYYPNVRYQQADFSLPVSYEGSCRGQTLASTQISSPTCGQANGSMLISPIGGKPPYTYQWGAAANFADSAHIQNLSAGMYELTLTDSTGCAELLDIALNDQNAPSISIDSQSVQTPICHGDSNGSIAVLATGPQLNFLWSNGETSPRATSLPGGRAIIRVTDGNNCAAYQAYRLEEPAPITADVDTLRVLKFGEASGTATVFPGGGNGFPYRYHWSNGWTGQQAAGLPAGTVSCTIIDAGGCEFEQMIQIEGPNPANGISISSTGDALCTYPSGDGTVSISVPATNTYSIDWAGAGWGIFIFGLVPGLYQAKLTDGNGNISYAQATVENKSGRSPTMHADVQAASCSGQSDGSIDLYLSGGSPPFTYRWENGHASSSRRNLPAGSYACEITQSNDCKLIAIVWVPEDPAPRVDFAYKEEPYLVSPRKTMIEAIGSHGSAPYSYSWNTGDSLSLISASLPGTYTATVTDSKGCTAASSFQKKSKTPFNALAFPATLTHDCNGNGMGSIALQLSGNPANYSIQWSHGPQNAHVQNLQAGSYTVSIYDSLLSCDQEISYEIRNLASFDLNALVHPVSCTGKQDGKIDLLVSGGNTSYQSLWSNGASGDHLRNLAPGNYTVRVSDSAGCADSLTVRIQEAGSSLQVAVGSVSDGNPGGQGYAFAEGSGGWPPYDYQWNTMPIQLGDTARGLFGGTYEVRVRDSAGCIIREQVSLDAWVNIDEPEFGGKMTLLPNPNRGDFWLKIELNSPQDMELHIFDMKGQLVYLESLGHHTSLKKHLQLHQLPAGLYLLQIQAETEMVREKLLILNE
jgi:hypothetical protein